MKYKARLKRLEARIKAWENIPKSIQSAYKKPGSRNK